VEELRNFLTKSIRETISTTPSSERRSLDEIAENLAKNFSDEEFFAYHRNIKIGFSPIISYCEIRFQASVVEIQSVVSEINKAAGIDVPDSLPNDKDDDAPASFDLLKQLTDFIKSQFDLNRSISGFEYFLKTILGSSGVSYLMLLIDSGAWRPWFVLWWIFIPFIYFSSVQRINKLGFGFGVTYLSVAAILGTSLTQFLRFRELEVQQIWYVLDVLYAFFVLAGVPKWVKRTFEEAQK
jgi:hypothetical protein